MRSILFAIIFSSSFYAFASAEVEKEISQISEAFGHLIGKNIDTLGVEFDMELVVKGLKDATSGKNSPMTEAECIEAISAVQEAAFKKKSSSNLAEAESFLQEKAKCKNFTSLEEGKIVYKVEKQGKGAKVEDHSNPVIRYVGKYIDGTVFGESKEDETISLDETIAGFQKGLVGMKEGEKRTLYIHPDYGYGTQGFLPPNSLLAFEIEIVKATTPKEQLSDSLTVESKNTKEEKASHVR